MQNCFPLPVNYVQSSSTVPALLTCGARTQKWTGFQLQHGSGTHVHMVDGVLQNVLSTRIYCVS